MSKKKNIKLCTAFLLLLNVAWAQNFNYSVAYDSSSYTSLTGATVLCAGNNCVDKVLEIELPFTFNFCGSQINKIEIEKNGYINFDKTKSLAIISFNNFGIKQDSTGTIQSAYTYKTVGDAGSRIIKIECVGLAQNTHNSTDFLNYQLWLYENGSKIEFHIGTNYLSTIASATPDSMMVGMPVPEDASLMEKPKFPVLIGLLNRNWDTETKGFFITQSPNAPQGQVLSGDAQMPYINDFPKSGFTYILTPLF